MSSILLPVSAQFGAWNVGGFGRPKDMACAEHWIGAGRTMGLLQALETRHRKYPNSVNVNGPGSVDVDGLTGDHSCGSDVVYVTNSWLSKLPHVQLQVGEHNARHATHDGGNRQM